MEIRLYIFLTCLLALSLIFYGIAAYKEAKRNDEIFNGIKQALDGIKERITVIERETTRKYDK